jgi:shikimate kinase
MKIYLIGMPGSGKSTLGDELAKALNSKFVDLDEEIEKKAGKCIKNIFKEDGEEYFRETESNLLKYYSKSNAEFVMSTGGGAPCYHKGIHIMNDTGVSIYLKISKQELYKRLNKGKESRPLLAKRESLETSIENLIMERGVIYDQAKVIVESDFISLQDLEGAISRI